jgi:hypothetical protein
MDNSSKKRSLPATNSGLIPGDFPLGSVESRAAARAMIERGKETGVRLRMILIGHPPKDCVGRFCHDVLSPGLGPGSCGLVSGELFVDGRGDVEEVKRSWERLNRL